MCAAADMTKPTRGPSAIGVCPVLLRQAAWAAGSLMQLETNVRCWPIVLQKSFLAGDGNFLEPLMRFARGDVRVHIGSHKNDHGPPYPSYRALQRRRRLKIDFREIFGVARFSTFATLSAMCGRLRVGKRNLHVAGLVGAAMCSACRCGSHDRWP